MCKKCNKYNQVYSAVAGFEPWTSVFSALDKQNDHLTQKAKSSCALEKEICVGMVLNWDGSAAEYFSKSENNAKIDFEDPVKIIVFYRIFKTENILILDI